MDTLSENIREQPEQQKWRDEDIPKETDNQRNLNQRNLSQRNPSQRNGNQRIKEDL